MKKYFIVLVSSIIAGMFIAMGASGYLAMVNTSKFAGAFLFGFGLYTVIVMNLFLYTGKVGFILDNKPSYFLDLLVGVIGNFIGIVAMCSLISLTRTGTGFAESAKVLVDAKMGDKWYSILILSFFCGVMIYLGVKGHKEIENPVGKVIYCFLAVMIFSLCGFEHCIANAAYFTYAHYFSWKALFYFVLMIIGNGLGSVTVDALFKYLKHIQREKKKE